MTDLLAKRTAETCILNAAKNKGEYLVEDEDYENISLVQPCHLEDFRKEMLRLARCSVESYDTLLGSNNPNECYIEILKNKVLRYMAGIDVDNIVIKEEYNDYYKVIRF